MANRRISIVIKLEGVSRAKQGFNSLGASAKEASIGQKKLEKSLKETNKKLKALQPTMQKISLLQKMLTNSFIKGNLAARGLSMAFESIRSALTAGIGGAIAYEFSMKKVAAITGITGDGLESLDRTVRSLAAVSPRTAREVADTALAMAKLGLSGREVEAALEGVIGLSVALDEDVESVGATLVAVKNVFQMEAKDLTAISDQLFTSFSKSALNLEKFSTAFSFAGGAARLAGVEFSELSALMAVLSNAGIRSSTIGTQLRSIFLDMSDATSKFGKASGGVTVKQHGLVKALMSAKAAIEGQGEAKRIFGKRAVSVIDILTKNIDKFEELTDIIESNEGAVKKAAGVMEKTITVRAKQLASAFLEMNIQAKEFYGPTTQGILIGLTEVTNKFAELVGLVTKGGAKKWTEHLFDPLSMVYGAKAFPERPEDPEWTKKRDQALKDAADAAARKEEERKRAAERSKAAEEDEKERLEEIAKAIRNITKEYRELQSKTELTGMLGGSPDMLAVYDKYGKLVDKLIALGGSSEALSIAKEQQKLFDTLSKSDVLDKFERLQTKDAFAEALGEPRDLESLAQSYKEIGDEFLEVGAEQDALKALKEYRSALDEIAKIKEEEGKEAKKAEAMLFENIATTMALETSFQALNSTISMVSYTIGNNLVGALFNVKTATVDMGETFKSIGVMITSEIVKMITKLTILKAVTSFFPGLTPFMPALGFGQFKAKGMNATVTQPTPIMAGEAGPERVRITPASRVHRDKGGEVALNVNIAGDVYGKEKFMDGVNEAMQEINRRYAGV